MNLWLLFIRWTRTSDVHVAVDKCVAGLFVFWCHLCSTHTICTISNSKNLFWYLCKKVAFIKSVLFSPTCCCNNWTPPVWIKKMISYLKSVHLCLNLLKLLIFCWVKLIRLLLYFIILLELTGSHWMRKRCRFTLTWWRCALSNCITAPLCCLCCEWQNPIIK